MPKTIEHVDANGWRKLVKINDWGVNGYFWKAVKSDAGTWGIAGQDPAQQVLPDQRVRVLWKDGSTSIEKLLADRRSEDVGDMGHTYSVSTYTLYLDKIVNGTRCRVEVDGLRFKKI